MLSLDLFTDISQFQIVLLSSIKFSSKGSKLFAIPEGTSLHTDTYTDTYTNCSFVLYQFQKYPFKYVYTTQVRVVFAVGEFASASPTAPFTLKLSEEQREVLPRTLVSYRASGSNWWQCQLPVCPIIIIMYTYDLQ